jgi:ABC-type dipeptide/oligopeptide/nickel transport system permease component
LLFVFTLAYLAPDGARAAMLGSYAGEPAATARIDASEHFAEAIPLRFVRFVAGVAHGDFGASYVEGVDVDHEIGHHLLFTALLVALAVVMTADAFGAAIVFLVLAVEAVLGWPGLGRVLASAVDARDLVVSRAVLTVALLGGVLIGPGRPLARHRARTRGRHPGWVLAWAWLFIVAVAIAFAIRLPVGNPWSLYARHAAASGRHWFGTDDLGHDVASRLLWGMQGTVLLGIVATVVGCSLGMLVGALAAEVNGARRGVRVIGRLGVPAIGISVGLATVLSREPVEYWLLLVPLTIGPAVRWGTDTFAAGVPGRRARNGAVAAVLVGLANAVAGEAVLGALGLVPVGGLTLGVLLDDVRTADHRPLGELVVVVVAVVVTVVALRTAARSLEIRTRPTVPRTAGTMV